MKIGCEALSGFKLHLGDAQVEIKHGINVVEDDFGKAWMALHRDSSNVLPMVHDGLIYEVPEDEPSEAKSEPEAAEPEEPESEPVAALEPEAAPEPIPEPIPEAAEAPAAESQASI